MAMLSKAIKLTVLLIYLACFAMAFWVTLVLRFYGGRATTTVVTKIFAFDKRLCLLDQ